VTSTSDSSLFTACLLQYCAPTQVTASLTTCNWWRDSQLLFALALWSNPESLSGDITRTTRLCYYSLLS